MKELKNLIFIFIGSFFLAIATVMFLNPNNFITGGGIGIAQLFCALFPSITLGTWIALVSVPLILIGLKFFGKAFVIKTLFAIILISTFSDLFKEILKLPPATNEPILALIFGGLLIGVGLGFVMLGKSSTGGTSILAEIITIKTRYKTAQILLIIDALIMLSSIFVYRDIEKALFSVVGVYLTSRVVDMLLSGSPGYKAVTISSKNVEKLSSEITKQLGEQGTLVKGVSLKQNLNTTLIFVIMDISKLQLLKQIVNKNDPDALLIVQEASELYGRDY